MVLGRAILGLLLALTALGGCISPAYDSAAPAGPASGGTGSSSGGAAFQVSGLTSSSVAVKSKTWSWACAGGTGCTYRFVIDQVAATTPSGAYGSTTSASQITGNGTYYIHVQARDAAGVESPVAHVSAVLDNIAPSVTGLSNDSSGVQPKTWMWACSESACQFRYLINQTSNSVPTGSYLTTTSATHSGAAGTYYLHVQARDAAGNESSVVHVSAVLSAAFTVAGSVSFDWVPARDNVTEGGIKLDYTVTAIQKLPARRIRVEALDSGTNAVLATTSTNDSGAFSLSVAPGKMIKVRAYAHMLSTGNTPDTIGLENCSGASWDAKVVDNTQSKALYAFTSSGTYSTSTSGVELYPRLVYSTATHSYTDRAAAPFAILDTVLRELELVCQGNASQVFPPVLINWSANNTPSSSGSPSTGNIGTSYFTVESNMPSLYILGKQDVDTDEYDDHVVAHEFGHYLENSIYRSDTIGGAHSSYDSLDPRVAFGEGFGNSISAMTFNDAVYVDTSSNRQESGFQLNMDTAPYSGTGTSGGVTYSVKDKSVFSETSAQHFLWMLYKNRRTTDPSTPFARIHTVLANDQKITPSFTTLNSFAAYYRGRYAPTEENLDSLWSTTLASPVNALCSGTCPAGASGASADPFDVDGDLGSAYASSLTYPAVVQLGSGQGTYTAAFWNLYPLASSANSSSAHNRMVSGGYGYSYNKLGMSRWYRYSHTGANQTITVSVPSVPGQSCSNDLMDLYVVKAGSAVAMDEDLDGCPSTSFTALTGSTYVFELRGFGTDLSGFALQMSP